MRDENLCPKYNSKMISRNGKFGVFWGCSNFPQCNGTRDSMGRSKADRMEENIKHDVEDNEWMSNERDKISWNKK